MKSLAHPKASANELVKIESLSKFCPLPKELKNNLAWPKKFKAGALFNKTDTPKYFVFDRHSLWDMLCVIDAKLEENVSTEEYADHNPVGDLIDAIENTLPLNPKFIAKLKKGVQEAEKHGTIPFEAIKKKLANL